MIAQIVANEVELDFIKFIYPDGKVELRFQSRKQDYFNWKQRGFYLVIQALTQKFQSRKQDYFNWKTTVSVAWSKGLPFPFQSRKQDYFNWKLNKLFRHDQNFCVSVPQAGLF